MENVSFSEFTPSLSLTPFVQTYWLGNFNINGGNDFSQNVLPNGCLELIIHITDHHCALSKSEDGWRYSPEFTLLGLYGKPYEVKFSENVKVFGIRFFPDGVRNIFGMAPTELLATYEDATFVGGKALREFCKKLRELKESQEQVKLADQFLLRQLSIHRKAHDYTHFAMQMIRQSKGLLAYDELTDQVPISVRQLQREFKSLYGITVGEYARLERMNTIHRYMLTQPSAMSGLTYDLNFADQSHFIREFKRYVGLPPKKFMKSRQRFIVNPGR